VVDGGAEPLPHVGDFDANRVVRHDCRVHSTVMGAVY
jgi:hypothetical protein